MTSPVKRRPHIADADYYRLGYQLAAQLLNRAASPPATAAARPSGAPKIVNDDPLAVTQRLLEDAGIVRAWIDARAARRLPWRRPTPQEQCLNAFLVRTLEPCCALIAARCMRKRGKPDEAQKLVDEVLRRGVAGELSFRAYYALACLEALDGDNADAIGYLSRALYEAPRARRAELAQWAENDPAFASVRKRVSALVAPVAPKPTTGSAASGADADEL